MRGVEISEPNKYVKFKQKLQVKVSTTQIVKLVRNADSKLIPSAKYHLEHSLYDTP